MSATTATGDRLNPSLNQATPMAAYVPPTVPVPHPAGDHDLLPSRMAVPAVTPFKSEERLNLSRERMRLWLDTSRGGKQSPRLADRARRSSWFAAVRGNPAVGIGLSALSAWWANHPLRAAVALANGMARSSVGPVARQRPFAVVGIGLAAGVIAVWMRPWRWILRPALFVGLATQVLNRVVAEMPMDSLLKVFGAFAGGAKGAPTAAAAEAVHAAANPPEASARPR